MPVPLTNMNRTNKALNEMIRADTFRLKVAQQQKYSKSA